MLIVDQQSYLGPTEQMVQESYKRNSDVNHVLIILICAIVCGAVGTAVAISILVSRSLGKLASGMNALAALNYTEKQWVFYTRSRFTEVSRCQHSFTALERYS